MSCQTKNLKTKINGNKRQEKKIIAKKGYQKHEKFINQRQINKKNKERNTTRKL